MPKQSLTIEIKDYLDERFDHVIDKIKGVDDKVIKLNGSVQTVTTVGQDNKAKITQLQAFVSGHQRFREDLDEVKTKCIKIQASQKYIIMAIVLGSFLWVKESRDFIVHAVLGTLGGL